MCVNATAAGTGEYGERDPNQEAPVSAAAYDDLIMDHIRFARNYRAMPDAECVEMGSNPLCGDEIAVYLAVRDGRVHDVSYECTCCGISMASASIMTQMVAGRRLSEAHAVLRQVIELLHAPAAAAYGDLDEERLALIETVQRFPARVGCATLAWTTLDRALKRVRNESNPQ